MEPKPIQVLVSQGQVVSLAETVVWNGKMEIVLSAERNSDDTFRVFANDPEHGGKNPKTADNIRDAAAKAVDIPTAVRIVNLFEMRDVTESKIIELFGGRAHLVDVTVIE